MIGYIVVLVLGVAIGVKAEQRFGIAARVKTAWDKRPWA